MTRNRFARLAETDRETVQITVDGRVVAALEGDTLLVAILNSRNAIRRSEFGDDNRAGFCLMGACQDCWVSTEDGKRLRACLTPVDPGMRIRTTRLTPTWTNHE